MDEDFDFPVGDEEIMNDDPMDLPDEAPALKVGEEKEIGKEGLKKKLVKEGQGWETPEVGDEVEVHYTGTLLDGTKFDSSRGRGTPVKFKLGQGQVIKGWDQGIKTMKKGEVATVTIPHEHAFGSTESKQELAVVPPNSTVVYEIELVSFVKDKESWDMNNAEKTEAAERMPECCICLEDVVVAGVDGLGGKPIRSVAILQCGHIYHFECICLAFDAKGAMQCPYCRNVEEDRGLFLEV